jgi:D-tyrosyl-tRNA(Tyr) deacylase
VCPKYNLQNLNQEMLEQAMQRAFPKAEFAILDWKGLGGFKKEVRELLEKNNVVYKKTKEL